MINNLLSSIYRTKSYYRRTSEINDNHENDDGEDGDVDEDDDDDNGDNNDYYREENTIQDVDVEEQEIPANDALEEDVQVQEIVVPVEGILVIEKFLKKMITKIF